MKQVTFILSSNWRSQVKIYLLKLADVTKMEVLAWPYAYSAHEMGYGGWIHWKGSGGHFYSYQAIGKRAGAKPFFSVDFYTCKPFPAQEAAEFMEKFLRPIDLVWREIKV